jgi:hypothetical protein
MKLALANVNESDIAKIQVGYDATVNTLAFPDAPFKGKMIKYLMPLTRKQNL